MTGALFTAKEQATLTIYKRGSTNNNPGRTVKNEECVRVYHMIISPDFWDNGGQKETLAHCEGRGWDAADCLQSNYE